MAISASVVAIIYSMILVKTIKDRPKGSKKMADIARAIKTGDLEVNSTKKGTNRAQACTAILDLFFKMSPPSQYHHE